MIPGVINNQIISGNNYKNSGFLGFKCRFMAVFPGTNPETDIFTKSEDRQERNAFRTRCFLGSENHSLLNQIHDVSEEPSDPPAFVDSGNDKGWGFITFINGQINKFRKSTRSADKDKDFIPFVKEAVNTSPDILIGHIRNVRNESEVTYDNTQPVTYKDWAMVHHGEMHVFQDGVKRLKRAQRIHDEINTLNIDGLPPGNSDTNVAFKYFLSRLNKNAGTLNSDKVSEEQLVKSFNEMLRILAGSKKGYRIGDIIVTNGKYMIIYNESRYDGLNLGIKEFKSGKEDILITNKVFNETEKNISWKDIPRGSFYVYEKNEKGEFSRIEEQVFINFSKKPSDW